MFCALTLTVVPASMSLSLIVSLSASSIEPFESSVVLASTLPWKSLFTLFATMFFFALRVVLPVTVAVPAIEM